MLIHSFPRCIKSLFLRDGLTTHRGAKVTLGAELRNTAEVQPPARSPKLRRSSTFPVPGCPAKSRLCQKHHRLADSAASGSLIHIRSAIACRKAWRGPGKALLLFAEKSFTVRTQEKKKPCTLDHIYGVGYHPSVKLHRTP
ncbi:unnamed protein product [Strongylus vulgaris]|uniref:Uncharacterized protein n=1 Tax=Strongylus vulgaris TaxID=40348 RepID=A0A3P7LA85_STRVU|nr:unnamed protein product [Strongylus vulgaris]